jgi:ferredoxin
MCEFCHQHGEGKKWYLQAKNYSDDLLSDLKRRDYIRDFLLYPEHKVEAVEKLKVVRSLPSFVQSVINPFLTNRIQKSHIGQVVPIEDCREIFESLPSIVRIACYCRHSTTSSEQRYCYCLSAAPNGGKMAGIIKDVDVSYLTGPDTSGLELLTHAEAMASLKEHESEGLIHTVWTFVTPFIGAICNCDRTDCLAMRATVGYGFPLMFRSEYIASVDTSVCNGCRQCLQACQFGALEYSAAMKKMKVDPRRCFGCGICRVKCERQAINLYPRASVAVAANLW